MSLTPPHNSKQRIYPQYGEPRDPHLSCMPQAIKAFTSSASLFAGSLAARLVSRFLFGGILSGKNRVELRVLVVALRGELKR